MRNRGQAGRVREASNVREDIAQVVRLLEQNRRRFDLAEDEDLIDAFIFERNALLARYRYLLRAARGERQPSPAGERAAAGEGRSCLTPFGSEGF